MNKWSYLFGGKKIIPAVSIITRGFLIDDTDRTIITRQGAEAYGVTSL
jgi:hypothetical protein